MARTRNRRSRDRDRNKKGALRGWAIFLASAAILLLGAWQAYVQMSGRLALDRDLCPTQGEVSLTAVLVDLTDPLSVAQRQDFLNQLERIRNEVPKYGRLTLYKVDATKDRLLEPVLDLCNPGDGSDVTEANGNPKKDRERWRTEFSEPVDRAFEALTEQSGAAESPIFQSVQSVTLTQLQRPNAVGKPKKLILVSDLLQNSGDLNFYREIPTLEQLKQASTYQTSRSDLRGVDMEMWMLTRPAFANIQNTRLGTLWLLAFKHQGAAYVRVHNING